MQTDSCDRSRRWYMVLLILCATILAGGCAVDVNGLLVDVADAAGQSILNSLLDALSVSLAT